MNTDASASTTPVHLVTRIACSLGLLASVAWLCAGLFVFAKTAGGDRTAVAFFLMSVPAIAWLTNFSVWAVFYGRAPRQPCWPFASFRVLLFYVAFLPLALRAMLG